MKKLEIK